jgi:hypothetical protein
MARSTLISTGTARSSDGSKEVSAENRVTTPERSLSGSRGSHHSSPFGTTSMSSHRSPCRYSSSITRWKLVVAWNNRRIWSCKRRASLRLPPPVLEFEPYLAHYGGQAVAEFEAPVSCPERFWGIQNSNSRGITPKGNPSQFELTSKFSQAGVTSFRIIFPR